MAHVKQIKFRATWPDAGSYGLIKVREVVFELGLGPCNKHVLHLKHEITSELLTITQTARNPDDLEEPRAWWPVQHKLEKHEQAERQMMRDRPMAFVMMPPRFKVTGWLWWTKYEEIKPDPLPNVAPHPDLLEPAELAALKAELSELYKAHAAWGDRLEVKTFTYKMDDIHGRIEVLK